MQFSTLSPFIDKPASELLEKIPAAENLRVEDLSILEVREMSEADLAVAMTPNCLKQKMRGEPAQETVVANLRARHHELARLLAIGLSENKICEMMEVSRQHLTLLQKSPSFRSLLFYYMSARDEQAKGLAEQTKMAAALAVQKTFEYLERPVEVLSGQVLAKMTSALLDRSGVGPTTNVNLNQGITPDAIRELRAARANGRFAKVIEAGPADTDGSAVRRVLEDAAVPAVEAENGSEEERPAVSGGGDQRVAEEAA